MNITGPIEAGMRPVAMKATLAISGDEHHRPQ
jgi:hypothetical protein